MPGTSERLHALDTVRGGALLAGIALHGSLSFFMALPAADVSQSQALNLLFFVIHLFRMSLFFVLAGFFGELLLSRRGAAGFVRDRATRIAVPLLLGWMVLLAPVGLVLLWGQSTSHVPPLLDIPLPPEEARLPLLHLWFLYYLLWCYGVRLLVARFVPFSPWPWLARIAGRWYSPLLLALPVAATLLALPWWHPWFGIPTPQNGLVPQGAALLTYGLAFAVGTLACRHRQVLDGWQAQARLLLGLAIASTVLCLVLAGPAQTLQGTGNFPGQPWRLPAYALAYGVALWSWCFALIGMALRHCSGHSAWRRYLADASYFLYLAHLPLVFLLQLLLGDLPLHWSVKFPLVLVLTLAPLLYVYDRWVRPGRLGALLNGKRQSRGLPGWTGEAPAQGRPEGSR